MIIKQWFSTHCDNNGWYRDKRNWLYLLLCNYISRYWLHATIGPHIAATKIFTIEEVDTVIVWRISRENVKTFRWKYGRIEDAISIITHYVPINLLHMPNADGRGRSRKIIVEQPGGNVAITEGQHRDDYTLYSAMYQRITRHACLFVEHANINPIIGCLSYSISQFPISALCNSSETLKRKRVEILSLNSSAMLQPALKCWLFLKN